VRAQINPHAEDVLAVAQQCRAAVIPAMDSVRIAGDALELLVEDGAWPLPKYHEMLFVS
jgi:glutamine synthetase